jgi:hypothetical protein
MKYSKTKITIFEHETIYTEQYSNFMVQGLSL